MATAIGKIESIEGSVEVVHADGSTGTLEQGAVVYADDAITTGENANIRIGFLDGSGMNIGSEFTAILDRDVFDPALIPEDDGSSQVVLDESDREVAPDSGHDTEGNGEILGTVATAEGMVEAVGDDGKVRELEAGDALYANDVIRVGADGNVSLRMVDGSDLSFGPGTTVRMDDTDVAVPTRVVDSGLTDAEAIQIAILAGQDPTDAATAPAPAAGEADSSEGGIPVVIPPSPRAVTPDSGHETHGFELPYNIPDQDLLEPEEPGEARVMTANLLGPDNTVFEAGLNPFGSNAPANTEMDTGTFTIEATDGINELVIGGTTFTLAQVLAFNGTQTVNTGEGVLTLDNYTGTNFSGTVTYTYELTAAIDNDSKIPTGNDTVTPAYFDDSVLLTVNGAGGATASDDLVVRAIDDLPTVSGTNSGAAVIATVHEDGLDSTVDEAPAGAAGNDLSDGIREPGFTTTSDEASGGALSLAGLVTVESGADVPPTVTFGLLTNVTALLPTLYSNSDPLNYIVNAAGNTLTATAGSGATLRTVFTLTVNADGSWDFDLDDQLDHVDDGIAANGAGDTESALYTGAASAPVTSIDFSAIVTVTATDADGDAASVSGLGAGDLVIVVENDIPTLTSSAIPTDPALSVLATVHEDGLSTAAEASDSSEGIREGGLTTSSDEASDTTGGAGSLTSLVAAAIGADDPGTPTFKLLDSAAVTLALPTLFSNGDALNYIVNPAGDTLTATAGSGATLRTVFTLEVNTDGTWDFDLDDQLDHVDDGIAANGEGDTESALLTGPGTSVVGIDFTAVVTAAIEDADGDIVSDTLTGLGAAAGSFAITVENDIPTLTSSAIPTDPALSVLATVHEDGLSTAAEASDSSEGIREGGLTTSSDEASDTTGGAGSLTSLVTAAIGADDPGTPTFKLLDSAAVTLALPTLFSNGDALNYIVNPAGDTLTATAGSGATLRTVFTLEVNTDGTWDFDLDDQLDHVDDGIAANGEGDTESALLTGPGTSVVGIDFTAVVTAAIEDADGDIVSDTLTGLGAAAGSFAITVENDIPTLTSSAIPTDPALSVLATVHEDGLSTAAEASDSSEGIREGGLTTSSDEASDTTGGAGSLTSLVTAAIGADDPGTPTFKLLDSAAVTLALPTLFSNGDALNYIVNPAGDTLTATAGSGATLRTVFTLEVNTDGTWDFDLDDQLDHVDDGIAANGEGDTESALLTGPGTSVVGIDFTAVVTAAIEDADGDIVSDTLTGLGAAAGSFAITVENDIPTLTSSAIPTDPALSVLATVHEDGLSTAAEASDSSEGIREGGLTTSSDEASDTTGGAGSLTSLVTAAIGADDPGTPTFKLLDSAAVTLALPTLFSNGDALNYIVNPAGDTLTATAGSGATLRTVFTLEVNTDGTWDFDLDDQLDHVDDGIAANGEGDTESALLTGPGTSVVGIDFTAVVTAAIEDADGDIVSDTLTGLGAAAGSFAITVENDIPTLTSSAIPTDPALSVLATVHEDGLSTAAEASDSSEGIREGGLTTSSDEASDTTGGAGSLTSLVTAAIGADDPGTPTFKLLDSAAVTLALPTLFSNGDALNYIVNPAGDTLTATAGSGATLRTVFTLEVNTDGTWDFDLDDQLDHVDDGIAANGEGDTESALLTGPGTSVVGIDFTAVVTAAIEDADGDIVSDTLTGLGAAAGSFAITVENDIPTLTSSAIPTDPALSVLATVHEDGLSTAAEASDSSEGIREGGLTTSSDEASDTTGGAGSLASLVTAAIGADDPGTPTFKLLDSAAVTLALPTLFSNGDALNYIVNPAGDTLTATAGSGATLRTVFTLEVNTDGTWDFDLDDQLDHVDDGIAANGEGDTESALLTGPGTSVVGIDFTAVVTAAIEDADGDIVSDTLTGLGAAAGSFAITVENDIPTLTSSAIPTDPALSVLATVHEDGLSTAAEASDSSEGIREGGLTTSSDEASDTTGGAGSLTSLVTAAIGADDPGTPTFKLLDSAAVTLALPTLFSNGDALNYIVNPAGDTLTATAGSGATLRTVFTLEVNTDGTWDFDLDDQLDHVDDGIAANGEGDTESALLTGPGTSVVGIDFTAVVTAAIEDADGDIVSDTLTGLGAAAGSFAITVENDIPTLTSSAIPTDPALSVLATVHEDGLSTAAEASDSSEGIREGGLTTSSDEASDTTGGAGSLTSLVTAAIGADDPGTPTFKLLDSAAVTLALPTLFSNGDALNYIVNPAGDTLTATAGSGATLRTVFTLEVNTDGTWDFDLDDQLDHVDDGIAANGEGDTESALLTGPGTSVVGIDFTAVVTAAIEDADGDIVSDTLTGLGAAAGSFAITVENDIPTLSATNSGPGVVTETVHEDGLSTAVEPSDSSEGIREGGLTTSSDEASGTAGSLSGLVTVVDGADEPTGILSFSLIGTATGTLPTLFSNGDLLSYSVNPAGDTLTATAGSGATLRTVFTLEVNADGSWDFDLDDQLDHVDDGNAATGAGDTETALFAGAGNPPVTSIDFSAIVKATVTDADGDTASINGLGAGDFSIVVENDVPTAGPATNTGQAVVDADTNLMLILDVSGSMGIFANFEGMTRLEVMIKSSLELLEQYDSFGDVKVNITTFSNPANPSTGWLEVEQAKDFLLALSSGGRTNYDDALNEAWNSFDDLGAIVDGQNISYFMSDGQPNENSISGTPQNDPLGGGDGIDSAEEAAWAGFLTPNNINSWSLGMGTGVTKSALDPIAYDGRGAGTDTDAIVVTDFSQLEATLVATIEAPPVEGELLGGGGGSGGAATIGADNGGWLWSFTVDPNAIYGTPVTYLYDQDTDTASVIGPSDGTFDTTTNEWTVNTPGDGTTQGELRVDMDTAKYTYMPPSPLTSGVTEEFGYTVIDSDGDTAGSILTLIIDAATGLPVVRDDFVITNQDPVDIPDAALLANDSPSNGSDQMLTDVSSAAGGTIANNSDGTVTFDDDGTDGGSFVYTNMSGGNTDTAVVEVEQVSGNILNGDYLDEILVGGSANEILNGGAGDDVLVGGGGDDILSGGSSSLSKDDNGADTFLWMNGETGTDEVTDFFVADTDPDTPDDVLNIADLLNDNGALDGLDDAAMTAALDGQYVSIASGTDTVVSIFSDGSGTGTPDQVIELTGFSTTGSSADIIESLLAGDNLVAE